MLRFVQREAALAGLSTKESQEVAVEHATVNAGDKFEAQHDGKKYTLQAVKHGEGVLFKIASPKDFQTPTGAKTTAEGLFRSPSAAAGAVIGPEKAVNGWTFWGIDGETAAKPAKKVAATAKASPKAAKKATAVKEPDPEPEDELEMEEEDEEEEFEFDDEDDEEEDE